jgi:hypothetical protein
MTRVVIACAFVLWGVAPASGLGLLYTLPGVSAMEDDFMSAVEPYDFDGDYEAEVLCRTTEPLGVLEVRELGGTLLWSYEPKKSELCPSCPEDWDWGYPRFANVDAFPGKELLVNWGAQQGDYDGFAVIRTDTGQLIHNFSQCSIDGELDFNGDGFQEILVLIPGDPSVCEIWGHVPSGGLEDGSTNFNPETFRLMASPNPGVGRVSLEMESPIAVRVHLLVVSPTGGCVRDLGDRELTPGRTRMEWDGLTDDNRLAPAGEYFLTATADDVMRTLKVIMIR